MSNENLCGVFFNGVKENVSRVYGALIDRAFKDGSSP